MPLSLSRDNLRGYLKKKVELPPDNLMTVAFRMLKGDQKIWDIGANIGTLAIATATLSNDLTVFAIEADAKLESLIAKVSRFNQDQRPNIHALPFAISRDNRPPSRTSSDCPGTPHTSETLETPSGNSKINQPRNASELTLDQLVDIIGPPGFINLTLEGSELIALQGATQILTSHKPAIYLDCSSHSYPECLELLKNQGYKITTYSIGNTPDPDYCALFVHSEDEVHLSRLQNMRANFS